MVRGDAVDDLRALVIALGHLHAQLDVRALQLVIDGLADVVQQARALGKRHIRAQLRGHQAGEVGHLDGMLEHVLSVAGAVAHAAEQLDELMVDAVHVRLEHGLLAGLADLVVHLAAGLFDHFLDARRMDAAIGDELFECDAGDLAADRIERGDDDGLGRVVNDQIDAGRGLEGADVAALPADDAALHVLIGQGDDGDGGLRDVVGGAALDRHGDDVARLLLGLVLGVLLDLANEHAGVVIGFLLDALDDHVLRFILGHLRDALQLDALLFFHLTGGLLGGLHRGLLARVHILRFLRQAVELSLLALQAGLAGIEVVRLLVERLLALGDAALAALDLIAAVADLAVKLVLEADDLLLGLEDAFLLLFLRAALGVVKEVSGVLLGTADLLFLDVLAVDITGCRAGGAADDEGRNHIQNHRPNSHSFFDILSISILVGNSESLVPCLSKSVWGRWDTDSMKYTELTTPACELTPTKRPDNRPPRRYGCIKRGNAPIECLNPQVALHTFSH